MDERLVNREDPNRESPSLASLASPPADPGQRLMIGEQLWEGLILRFEMGLSERDTQLWRNPPDKVEDSADHLRLMHRFDDYLLRQFSEWGWRILMSRGGLQRLAEWEKHAPELLERLGRELATRSRVLRGDKSAPFAEGIEGFADAAIEELTRLMRRQREHFGTQRRIPTPQQLAEWMKAQVESSSDEFGKLRANLAQLYGFVCNLHTQNKDAFKSLARGDMRAGTFFYLWFAFCSNRSLKDVQNEISRRRADRRR